MKRADAALRERFEGRIRMEAPGNARHGVVRECFRVEVWRVEESDGLVV